jgi:hypothetical protein
MIKQPLGEFTDIDLNVAAKWGLQTSASFQTGYLKELQDYIGRRCAADSSIEARIFASTGAAAGTAVARGESHTNRGPGSITCPPTRSPAPRNPSH